MKRKLINYEAFECIQNESLSAAERELEGSKDILATALGVDGLELDCFGESSVVYETLDGTYVRADFSVKNNHVVFENIEELVIDEETTEKKSRQLLSDMLEAILNKEDGVANELFDSFMGIPSVRRQFTEGREGGFVRPNAEAKAAGKSKSKNQKQKPGLFKARKNKLDSISNPNNKKRAKRDTLNLGDSKDPNYQKKYHKLRKSKHVARKVLDDKGNVKIRRTMKEWLNLSENVAHFITFKETGQALRDAQVKHDDKGNVVAVRIPAARLRNESKLLSLNYSKLQDEYKTLRDAAMELAENVEFCKEVANLKRFNALSNQEGLQQALESVIGTYPHVLYVTQEELAEQISEALASVGAKNYDDDVCSFLAEGILRTAHDVYADRVGKILKLARVELEESNDPYADFQGVVSQFYPQLDESFAVEMKVFEDLLNAVNEVHTIGEKIGDVELAELAAEYMEELQAICDGEVRADLELAEEVAEWLYDFAETNLNDSDWKVSNTAHMTVNGDVPETGEMAKKSYTPANDFSHDWGDSAPMLDDEGKSYKSGAAKKARTNSWSNWSSKDTYPNLTNPYLLKPFGDYTMKGETGVDKDWKSGFAQIQNGDTWPNLKNPNVPDSKTPKMKNGAGTDLVEDL